MFAVESIHGLRASDLLRQNIQLVRVTDDAAQSHESTVVFVFADFGDADLVTLLGSVQARLQKGHPDPTANEGQCADTGF